MSFTQDGNDSVLCNFHDFGMKFDLILILGERGPQGLQGKQGEVGLTGSQGLPGEFQQTTLFYETWKWFKFNSFSKTS